MPETEPPPEGLPAVNIRLAGQALRYLENCDDDEFHLLRGEVILVSMDPQIDGRKIIALPRSLDVLRVYQGDQYRITFYMSDPTTMLVLHIQALQA